MDIDALEREADGRPLTAEEIGGLAALLQSDAVAAEQHRAVLLLTR